ncbi:MAG: GTP 3',8-cyclase MoaA [Deltaproteobacteria bacterium]|nr:MAG: GTP 3',8-cyclase MoaA [Deltaproteobacteria bacterium]
MDDGSRAPAGRVPPGAEPPPGTPKPVAQGAPLRDPQGRTIRYLRLSITDRCNYRCTYCMPPEGFERAPRSEVLSIDELVRVARIFAACGVEAVRITGGEPTVRSGLVDLVAGISTIDGIRDVAMTTNGDRLAALARPLFAAGLRRLNISLDTLDPERHARITRGGRLAHVLAGIDAAQAAGFDPIKLNTVVIRGFNDDELERIVDFAWARGLVPRFIELMPVGEAGRRHGAAAVVPVAEMLERLGGRVDPRPVDPGTTGLGPAVYRAARGDPSRRIGFIGAVSEQFCATCNRLRVTAKGELRACLARPEGRDLRALLRSGASDGAMTEIIRAAVGARLDGHHFWQREAAQSSDLVVMTGVGG